MTERYGLNRRKASSKITPNQRPTAPYLLGSKSYFGDHQYALKAIIDILSARHTMFWDSLCKVQEQDDTIIVNERYISQTYM